MREMQQFLELQSPEEIPLLQKEVGKLLGKEMLQKFLRSYQLHHQQDWKRTLLEYAEIPEVFFLPHHG